MLLDEYNVALAHSNPPILQKLIGLKFIHNCISTLANSLFRQSNNSKVTPVDHFVYYAVEMSEDCDRESDTTIEYPLEDEDMGECREETSAMSREEPPPNKRKGEGEKAGGGAPDSKRKPPRNGPPGGGEGAAGGSGSGNKLAYYNYVHTFYIKVLLQINIRVLQKLQRMKWLTAANIY